MADPKDLLLTLANHDSRACFAYDVSEKKFTYVNPSFLQLFESCTDPVQLHSMLHPQDVSYVEAHYMNLQPGEFKDHLEFRMVLPDRKVHTLMLSVMREDGNLQLPVITGYLEDISAYRNHEEKLRDLSNKKNSILNILSHDLAGPLGSIQNFSYILSRKIHDDEDDQVRHIISSIDKISRKCIQMIQEFIKLEFIESAGVELSKTRLDLVTHLEVFMDEYLKSQDDLKKNFEFLFSDRPIFVDIDESKFFQVVNNLISNAMKFTPDGGTIRVHVQKGDRTVVLTVADSGIGIPKKFHENLFEKFSEARRIGLKGEPSVGLGMSIIKTIVEWHHGKIWFESIENQGTTFYIEIPTVA